jgi:undecaprenyl-diphosphatase
VTRAVRAADAAVKPSGRERFRALRRSVLERAAQPLARFRIELGVLLIGLLLSVLAFEEVADDVFQDIPAGDLDAQRLDAAAAAWFKALRGPALTQAMIDLTALGSVSVLVVVSILVLGALAIARDGFRTLHFVAVGLGAMVIPSLLKALFDRPRPEFADRLVMVGELSFPSGHAFGATAIYLFIALWAWHWRLPPGGRWCACAFALLLIACVGLSRIYLGVHYTTDVMAGTAAGAAWALLVGIVFLLIERRQPHPAGKLPPPGPSTSDR